jgi:hypothetical protein
MGIHRNYEYCPCHETLHRARPAQRRSGRIPAFSSISPPICQNGAIQPRSTHVSNPGEECPLACRLLAITCASGPLVHLARSQASLGQSRYRPNHPSSPSRQAKGRSARRCLLLLASSTILAQPRWFHPPNSRFEGKCQ